MDLPIELREAIENTVSGRTPAELKKAVSAISDRYRNDSGKGKKLVAVSSDADVYAVFRFPATFAAAYDSLSYALEFYDGDIKTVIDVGAGSGAATWASYMKLSPSGIRCLEREPSMRKTGEKLLDAAPSLKEIVTYENFDLLKDDISGKADLVMSSYVLNELEIDAAVKSAVKMWEATEGLMLIIEPGTPAGFAVIRRIREEILKLGGNIVAPCPHEGECRIAADDWCHFTCRVQRSKLHKLVKEGDAPYEDEKYAYIAFSRTPAKKASMRVLRHPYITKGQIELQVCTEGENKAVTVRKRDGELFKKARKCKQGDSL